LLAFAAEAGAFAALGGQHAGVAGVGITPAQAGLQPAGQRGVIPVVRAAHTSAAVRPGAPVVVVLTGSSGGEDRATAEGLAMSGYPALALAYFKEPGLPQCACGIPLEYFERAVSWLRAQPAGHGRPVVLYGLSLGSEAVLLTASYLPHLADAVVASSPTVTVDATGGPVWTFGGKPVEPGTSIPVTRIRVPLLIGDGGQDGVWAAAASATLITHELTGSPGHPPVTNLYYPGAGHGYFGLPRITRSSPTWSWAAACKPTPWPPSSSGPA
jgi:dienelactone hydrolase